MFIDEWKHFQCANFAMLKFTSLYWVEDPDKYTCQYLEFLAEKINKNLGLKSQIKNSRQ